MGRFAASLGGLLLLLLGNGEFVFAADGAGPKNLRKAGDATGPGTQIVDGDRVNTIERYPYMAGLTNQPSNRRLGACGGALIHPRVVLTHAACDVSQEDPPPRDDDDSIVTRWEVDVGRWNWVKEVEGDAFDTHDVQDVIRHPGWTGDLWAADDPDFALVLLRTPSTMVPVTLARDEDDSTVGNIAAVLGWGIETRTLEAPLTISTKLKEATIRIAAADTCGMYKLEEQAASEVTSGDVEVVGTDTEEATTISFLVNVTLESSENDDDIVPEDESDCHTFVEEFEQALETALPTTKTVVTNVALALIDNVLPCATDPPQGNQRRLKRKKKKESH